MWAKARAVVNAPALSTGPGLGFWVDLQVSGPCQAAGGAPTGPCTHVRSCRWFGGAGCGSWLAAAASASRVDSLTEWPARLARVGAPALRKLGDLSLSYEEVGLRGGHPGRPGAGAGWPPCARC